MFEGAKAKLENARTALARLRALVGPPIETSIKIISGPSGVRGAPVGISDPVTFSEAFSSCVAQIRSIGDAVLKNVNAMKLSGFDVWKDAKKNECKNDELMKFINDKRNSDLHNGLCPLAFMMNAFAFSNKNVGAVPFPDASLRIDGTGPYWIVDQGTPEERRIPCELQDSYTFTVSIIDPPIVHKGKPLPSSDPITICSIAEKYYAELLFEARKKFGE